MVGCLLTTQQRSGPGSAVTRFIGTTPYPLSFSTCAHQDDLAAFVTSVLTEFGGLWRTKNIGREAAQNIGFLQSGGWEQTFQVLEHARVDPSPEAERTAARFIQDHFRGFGPKQFRNLLLGSGIARFETPIDSRITKWLTEFGFPVRRDGNTLTDRRYYESIVDEFQRLCAACDILPCILDAVIFSSFDDGAWTDENVVW